MDPSRDRAAAAVADEKPRRRGSGAGGTRSGSKKSSRRKPSSSSSRGSPGSGGDRAQGYGTGPHVDSRGSAAGGGAARADILSSHGVGEAAAQGKGHSRPVEAELSSHARSGAKGVRRESGRSAVASRDDGRGSDRGPREKVRQEQPAESGIAAAAGGGGGSVPNSVDRGILEK